MGIRPGNETVHFNLSFMKYLVISSHRFLIMSLSCKRTCFYLQTMYLKEIAEYMDIPATNPQRFVAHRWLSTYDVGMQTRRMLPAYKVNFSFTSHTQSYNEPVCSEMLNTPVKLWLEQVVDLNIQYSIVVQINKSIFNSRSYSLVSWLRQTKLCTRNHCSSSTGTTM